MNYRDLYQMIEQDVFAYLQSDTVIGQRAGAVIEPGSVASSVASAVTKAIGAGADGKVGLGYLVLAIEDLIDEDPEVTFGPLKLPIVIQIVENVILNQGPRGTKYPIRTLAAYAQKILKAYSAQNLTTDFIPDKPAINLFTPDEKDHPNMRVCQINFHTFESDPNVFQQVSSPFLTPSASVSPIAGQNNYPLAVTIQADAGSTVYFTTDGSPPWSGNAAATRWDGLSQVPIDGPCFFRARAFAPGLLGSKASSIFFA